MRPNPKLDVKAAILELAVGEALISLLDAKGTPSVTERALVVPPVSRIGPITPDERQQLIADSPVAGIYEKAVDRESAFERLKQRAEAPAAAPAAGSAAPAPTAPGGALGSLSGVLFGTTGPRGGHHEGLVDAFAKSAARSIGSTVARQITRGVLGSLLGGGRR
jgi:hypothetical protein